MRVMRGLGAKQYLGFYEILGNHQALEIRYVHFNTYFVDIYGQNIFETSKVK